MAARAGNSNGETVPDVITVTVKPEPAVASLPADVSCLEIGATRKVPVSGMISEPDGAINVQAWPTPDHHRPLSSFRLPHGEEPAGEFLL